MKKIGIVAFSNYPSDFRNNDNRRRFISLREIAVKAEEDKVSHILFPGSTLYYKTKDDTLARKHLSKIISLFKDRSIIFEMDLGNKTNNVPYGVYSIEKGKIVKDPICQLFAHSYDSKEYYEKLWEETFIHHNRIIRLDGITFLIWVCGEINILKNIQSKNNIVRGMRYDFTPHNTIHKLPYDVFFNPTHGMLTNLYNKYRERLKYMSKSNRYGFISLNVDNTQVQRTGAILAFHNSREILKKNQKKLWSGDNWVMEVIDYIRR